MDIGSEIRRSIGESGPRGATVSSRPVCGDSEAARRVIGCECLVDWFCVWIEVLKEENG